MRLLYWLLGLHDSGTIAHTSNWFWYMGSPLPLWGFVVVGVLGLLAAALNFFSQIALPLRTRLLLTAIRLAGFAIVLALLCQLELRFSLDRNLRPNVAVLTDVSASMGLKDAGGAGAEKTRLEAAREFAATDALKELSERAQLIPYSFAAQLQPDAPAAGALGTTHLFEAVDSVCRRERDLQSVIVLTDGNDTSGERGAWAAPNAATRRVPVYPVVFGNPNAPHLASVAFDNAASYVRLGDELRLNAVLKMSGGAASATGAGTADNVQVVRALLYEAGKTEPLAVRENIKLGGDPVEVAFVIKPEKAGTKTYRIAMDGVRGSVSEQTLAAEHRVQVLDSKIRVLYIDIPRDERKIIGHWLARDPVVALATLTLLPKGGWYAQGALQHKNAGDGIPNQEADLYKYDVVIFGDIPRAYFRSGGDISETKMQWLAEFVSRRGGGLIALGGASVYAAGQYQDSALSRILPFEIKATEKPQIPKAFRITPTSMGLSHPAMQLESDPKANRDAWLDLPSLDGCNVVGKVKPGASLLAVRMIEQPDPGQVLGVPVMAAQNVGKGQVLALSVDTTWRWEMQRPPEGEDYFRRFWGNALRALAPDPRLEPGAPQIRRHESQTAVGETITLSTRLVDGVFEPIRNANVTVKIASPSGKLKQVYPSDGRSTPGLYEYQVTLNEPGLWKVETTYAGKTASEEINAGGSLDELDDPRAKPEAMAEFAKATGGQSFAPTDGKKLLAALELVSRHTHETATVAVWNLPAMLLLMVALVCLDCFIRKRRGLV